MSSSDWNAFDWNHGTGHTGESWTCGPNPPLSYQRMRITISSANSSPASGFGWQYNGPRSAEFPRKWMTMRAAMRVGDSFAVGGGCGLLFTPNALSGTVADASIDGFNFTVTSRTVPTGAGDTLTTASTQMSLLQNGAGGSVGRTGPTLPIILNEGYPNGGWVVFQIGFLTNLYAYDAMRTARFYMRHQTAGSGFENPGSANWTSWADLTSGTFTFVDPYNSDMWSYDGANLGIKTGVGLRPCFWKRWSGSGTTAYGKYVDFSYVSIETGS